MIEFQIVAQDYVYRQGAPVIVSGSMGFMQYPGKQPAVTLKVVLNDVSKDGVAITNEFMPPASISLVGLDDESTAADQIMSAPSELPNSRIAAFSIEHFLPVLKRIVERKELAILFNRKNGGTDVRVLVDLSVEGLDRSEKQIRGTQTIDGFLDCSDKLLQDKSQPSRIR